jgi:ligand-binding sensor domain-containing protein
VGLTFTEAAGHAELVSLASELPAAVRAMMEDREGNLWLATDTQGFGDCARHAWKC